MVYQYKIAGLFPVDAQTAGEELHRIYEDKGQLDPSDIVNESRPATAPLHACFEWDDEVAAEKYRRVQAGKLVRSITVVQENKKREPVEVRAFVQSKETYTPIEVVVNSREQMLELLSAAMSELRAFERKYAAISQLAPVFEAIKRVSAREVTDARPTI